MFLISVLIFFMPTISVVKADRGMISVSTDVSIYEPGQKAIIAWDGKEEILILSTDVFSNGETFVVEMLPLPSNPKRVELASFKSFETLQEIINEKLRQMSKGNTMGRGDAIEGPQIVFHEKIGSHDITIVVASGSSELVDWMKSFLGNNSITQEVSLRNFEPVVEEYMARGFRYYVLDIITVSQEQRSVEPILYWFNTSFLYYPLAITSPLGGNTNINLFLLTKTNISLSSREYYPLRLATYTTSSGEGVLETWFSNGEISTIDLRLGELMNTGAWLYGLIYEGTVSQLSSDVMITWKGTLPDGAPTSNATEALTALVAVSGATLTLLGITAMRLVMRQKKQDEKT